MHESIVTNNLRAGSVSLVLIQNVSKGNNYCVLLCCIFSLTWHLLWVGRKVVWCCSFFSHFLCHLAVGRLSPGSAWAAGPGMGKTQKRPSRKCKRAPKTFIKQYFGKTLGPFAPFPASSPCWGKGRRFSVFLGAAVPQPVLQCHLPIAGQDSGGSSPSPQLLLQNTRNQPWKKEAPLIRAGGRMLLADKQNVRVFFFFFSFSYPAT